MPKLTITVDPDVETRARQDVADGKAASVSAWLNEAARDRMERADLDDVLAEIFAATGGPPTVAERAAMQKHVQDAAARGARP